MNARVARYLGTAIWSSTDDDGTPLDKNYRIADFAPEAVHQATRDVSAFFHAARSLIRDLEDAQVADDFWLTRAQHGAGFWARVELEADRRGERLTELAHCFGEVDVYVGDDGRLYFSGGTTKPKRCRLKKE